IVFLIFLFSDTVILAFIGDHCNRFVESSQAIEVFYPLRVIHCAIFVIVQKQEWSFYIFDIVNWRITLIGVPIIPIARRETSLAGFEYRLVGAATVPVDQTVHTDH